MQLEPASSLRHSQPDSQVVDRVTNLVVDSFTHIRSYIRSYIHSYSYPYMYICRKPSHTPTHPTLQVFIPQLVYSDGVMLLFSHSVAARYLIPRTDVRCLHRPQPADKITNLATSTLWFIVCVSAKRTFVVLFMNNFCGLFFIWPPCLHVIIIIEIRKSC